MNDELRRELERMLEDDRAIRKRYWVAMQEHGDGSESCEAARKAMVEVDAGHVDRLIEIIEEHGWPGLSLVGETAGTGAFLVLQHADLAVQQTYLPLLRQATEAGEAPSKDLPLLEDRVRMREGRDQLYGSQVVKGTDGKFELWPIEDEAHVDERRAKVGLMSLAAYLKRAGLAHLRPEDPGG